MFACELQTLIEDEEGCRSAEKDYEDAYREALLLLRQAYDCFGEPHEMNGARVCEVRGVVADDYSVFALGLFNR